jgi:hypothetical protein
MAQFYRTPIDIIEKVKDLSKSLTINEISKQLKISISTVKRYKTKDVDKIKLTKSQSVIRWRKRVKIKLIEYKGGKCVKCGYNKCIEALHFHHVDPKEKDFSISGKTLSFEKMKKEVDKCILVCSNCHSEIHSETKQ